MRVKILTRRVRPPLTRTQASSMNGLNVLLNVRLFSVAVVTRTVDAPTINCRRPAITSTVTDACDMKARSFSRPWPPVSRLRPRCVYSGWNSFKQLHPWAVQCLSQGVVWDTAISLFLRSCFFVVVLHAAERGAHCLLRLWTVSTLPVASRSHYRRRSLVKYRPIPIPIPSATDDYRPMHDTGIGLILPSAFFNVP